MMSDRTRGTQSGGYLAQISYNNLIYDSACGGRLYMASDARHLHRVEVIIVSNTICRLSQPRVLARPRGDSAGAIPQRVLVLVHVLRDGAVASDGHEDVEVCEEAFDDVPAAMDALVRHAPDEEAADHDDVRAQCDCLEHVCTGADARVEDDRHLCLLCGESVYVRSGDPIGRENGWTHYPQRPRRSPGGPQGCPPPHRPGGRHGW